MTETATLLGVSRAAVSKVMSTYMIQIYIISQEEQWVKISIDRKRSSHTEKNCFKKKSELLQHICQQK
jgi:predicted transcriptional regulator